MGFIVIDKDLSVLANIAQILSVVGPVLFGMWAFIRNMERKQSNSQTKYLLLEQQLEHIEETLNKQFGGNSGGIRESINNMHGKIDKIENRVNIMATDVANLSGRFEQHIEEN